MTKERKTIIIPKEEAVFWLDKNGFWNNQYGKFEHKKIIDYFHASIRKDADGYHLHQVTDDYEEKVYFYYEDTALFVFDVLLNDTITLVLNTKDRILLKPESMFIQQDHLYVQREDERIKFTEQALMKLASKMQMEKDGTFIRIGQNRYPIAERNSSGKLPTSG